MRGRGFTLRGEGATIMGRVGVAAAAEGVRLASSVWIHASVVSKEERR